MPPSRGPVKITGKQGDEESGKGMKRFAAIIFIFLLAASVDAATYYVDTTRPDDTGDGLTEATAWKTLTKLNATTFVAGDTVRLHRGQTWTGMWTLLGSGASENPITITNYGTGALPILDANSLNAQALYINGNDFITVDGIDARNATTANIEGNGVTNSVIITNCASSGGNHGIWVDGTSGIQITNNTVTQGNGNGIVLLDATTTGGIVTGNVLTGTVSKSAAFGIFVSGSNGTLANNSATDWNSAADGKTFHLNSTTGWTVQDNTATGCDGYNFSFSSCTNTVFAGTNTGGSAASRSFYFSGGSGYGGTGTLVSTTAPIAFEILNLTGTSTLNVQASNSTWVSVLLTNCTVTLNNPIVTDGSGHAIYVNGGGPVVINNPTIRDIAWNPAYGYGDGINVLNASVTINGGSSTRCGGDGVSANGTAVVTVNRHIASEHGDTTYVTSGDGFTAHNTSTLNLNYCIAHSNKKSGVAVVTNSTGTIYNCTFYNNYDATLADDYGIYITSPEAWIVKNNITANHRYEVWYAPGTLVTSNNNLFYDSRGGNAFHWAGTAYNFVNYLATSGKDANSRNADPVFYDLSSHDFRLTPASPGVNNGVDVSLTQDFAGTTVPRGYAPDIGAYEYYGGLCNSQVSIPPCINVVQGKPKIY